MWPALALTALFVTAEAGGQLSSSYDQLAAGRKSSCVISISPTNKRMVAVDGRPQPLFWACLSGGGDDYRRAGFNAVMVELTYPGRDVPLEQAFSRWDGELLEVKRQGLYAVAYIHNSVHAGVSDPPFALDGTWEAYVRAIVRRYRSVPNLVGWVFSDEYGDALTYPDTAFRQFLRGEYRTIRRLNAAWHTAYASFGQIRFEYEREGHGRPEPSMAQPEFPFGIGPKAFDSARFKLDRTVWANRRFEEAVRAEDPDTPIWSGANNLGWAIPGIPPGWGAYCDFYPEFSGDDMLTQHVWAMDIARGPNARPAMQMLLPEHPVGFNWHLDARVLRGWMVESALHGAAGITFWPWSFLGADNRPGDRSTSGERIAMVSSTIRQLTESGIFEMRPMPTIAVLYEPYAEGWGAMSQVYGAMRHPTGEPLPLLEDLRFGTRFGQVEYLTPNTLDQGRYGAYGVILAPFACDLTAGQAARLRRYVEGGGVLVADVGFDCIRGGKVLTGMPADTRALFGIGSLRVSAAKRGPWRVTDEGARLLPGLVAGQETSALGEYGLEAQPASAVALLRGPGGQGLFAHRVGRGLALFCSSLGWSFSPARDRVVRALHEGLFARRAEIELLDVPPDPGPHFAADCEVVLYSDGYALRNMTDAAREFAVRVDGQVQRHSVPPREALLVRRGREIPLGTGLWPVETGPGG